jgi:ABC-type polysaccharide/polyol phosphate export permease
LPSESTVIRVSLDFQDIFSIDNPISKVTVSKSTANWDYDSTNRLYHPVEELYQAFRYRNLILQLLYRDITTRYKRSILGIAWTMINPLGTMIVMSIAFSQIFSATRSYPSYVLSGYLAWTFFSQTTTAAIVNLVWGGGLLNRVYIPRTAFALAAVGTGVVNLLLALIPLIIVELINGVTLKLTFLFFPVPLLILVFFSLGFGLLISSIAVYFPDVVEMFQIILNAWFYLTPIVYPDAVLPEATQQLIYQLNPLANMIKLFRMPIYDGILPAWSDILPSLTISLIMLVIGWWFFSLKSDEFAYRI